MPDDLFITEGKLIFPGTREVQTGNLVVKNGKIQEIDLREKLTPREYEHVLDADGLYVSPGFIDLQVNGGAGADFLNPNPEDLHRFAELWLSKGTTSFLATIITNPLESMNEAMKTIRATGLDNCIGFHLEGPFISTTEKGTHNGDFIKAPSTGTFHKLIKGVEEDIRLVTLAPELKRSEELIDKVLSINSVPSLGHTRASYSETIRALREGAKSFTHLFNAMGRFHHRKPGCVGAALDSEAYAGLVVDGHHVHPVGIRLALNTKGPDQIYLITDAITAAGMGRGSYNLGSQEIYVDEQVARLPDETISGSILTMDDAVRHMLDYTNLPIWEAVKMATLNPASLLGIEDSKGRLKPGQDADLTLFDSEIRIKYTIFQGKVVYAGEDREKFLPNQSLF